MSSVNKRYSHSFAQTQEDSVIRQPEQADVVSPTHTQQTLDAGIDDGHDDPTYPEASPDELLPPPDFRPFFTLIEDPDTGEHYHPSVHYVFSDDDPDFVTTAIVDATEPEQLDATSANQSATNRERMVLLDMGADGKTINNVQSLSSDWQVLKTTVGQAPSWADEVSRKDVPGLMLNIQGMESHKLKLQPSRRRNSQDDPMACAEAMIGGYTDCLATMQNLMMKHVLQKQDQDQDKEDQDQDKEDQDQDKQDQDEAGLDTGDAAA